MLFVRLYQIKAKEYKYPNQVYKVPVQSCFFDHFIMASLVKMTKLCFSQHYQVNDHTAEYVEAMEAGNSEEVATKCRAANMRGMQV